MSGNRGRWQWVRSELGYCKGEVVAANVVPSGVVAMGTIRVRILQEENVYTSEEERLLWQWVRSELGYCKTGKDRPVFCIILKWQWVRSELGYCKTAYEAPPPIGAHEWQWVRSELGYCKCVVKYPMGLTLMRGNGYDPS